MGVIVCAIRGGPESQATIVKAVTLAQETDLPLRFLYVVNRDLLSSASSNHARAISKQIRQMGRAVLHTAQAMASTQGIRARGLVRQGKVGNEIASLCHDLGADYLILGPPQAHGEKTSSLRPCSRSSSNGSRSRPGPKWFRQMEMASEGS